MPSPDVFPRLRTVRLGEVVMVVGGSRPELAVKGQFDGVGGSSEVFLIYLQGGDAGHTVGFGHFDPDDFAITFDDRPRFEFNPVSTPPVPLAAASSLSGILVVGADGVRLRCRRLGGMSGDRRDVMIDSGRVTLGRGPREQEDFAVKSWQLVLPRGSEDPLVLMSFDATA